jgi:hypothetical protein
VPKIKANSKGKIRKPGCKTLDLMLQDSEDADFLDFVKRFMVWEPELRIDPQ